MLDRGIAPWVMTFRAGWMDRAGVPSGARQAIADEVADQLGDIKADYVRLRFWMRKAD